MLIVPYSVYEKCIMMFATTSRRSWNRFGASMVLYGYVGLSDVIHT